MAPESRDTTSTISTELLASTALLFGAALLVAVLAAILLLPFLQSPGAIALFLGLILLADLLILFLFLRSLLRRSVLEPLNRIGEHAERIASGDFQHRIPPTDREELDRLVDSVNTMAERLIRDQRLLEENVRSLEETNRELVETSDELVRTARMASVGTLAGGIAHEVGNPLGALRTALDVARARAERGGQVGEPLEMALEEARRIDAIIRSVLQFVRSAAVAEQEWEAVDLAIQVEEAVELLERRGTLDGIGVKVASESPPCPPVSAHPQLIEQLLVNLLVNAVQAVQDGGPGGAPEEGGTAEVGDSGEAEDSVEASESAELFEGGGDLVEVRLRREFPSQLRADPRREGDPPGTDYSHRRRMARLREGERGTPAVHPGPDAVIEVRDRGPGIPEEMLEEVFDPFFTTRAPGEGTGMGLAITSRIVQELGGRLEAENRPDGGALFRVRLPGVSDPEASDPDPDGRAMGREAEPETAHLSHGGEPNHGE